MDACPHRSTPMDIRHCLLPMALALLAGCGRPQPPETERRPDPQAAAPHRAGLPARTPAGGTAADTVAAAGARMHARPVGRAP